MTTNTTNTNTTNAQADDAADFEASSLRPCACGCGGLTASKWVPGHDGKAKGLYRAVARGERSLESLPGRLAALAKVLVPKWGLGTVANDGALVWTADAKKATTKRPAGSHPAIRTLQRAADQLRAQTEGFDDTSDFADQLKDLIEDLVAATTK